tara:strand:- start:1578 stop:1709 length:132 start_codon:yes stop_codon:yes gene_type:complete
MRHLFLMMAVSGLFYTALSGSLHKMTVADCDAGIVRACQEISK